MAGPGPSDESTNGSHVALVMGESVVRALSQASHCAIHLECSKAFHGARACWTFDSTGYSTSGGHLPGPSLRGFVLFFVLNFFSKLDFF